MNGVAEVVSSNEVGHDRNWYAKLIRSSDPAVIRQIIDVGGCASPVWLRGVRVTRGASGQVVNAVASSVTANGLIAVRCMNRRKIQCPSCSHLYRGDAFHIAIAGMEGGKGVPRRVGSHPKVFVTLTAPGFGPVHRQTTTEDVRDRCRPRQDAPVCE